MEITAVPTPEGYVRIKLDDAGTRREQRLEGERFLPFPSLPSEGTFTEWRLFEMAFRP